MKNAKDENHLAQAFVLEPFLEPSLPSSTRNRAGMFTKPCRETISGLLPTAFHCDISASLHRRGVVTCRHRQ